MFSGPNKVYGLIGQGIRENIKAELKEFVLQDPPAGTIKDVRAFEPDVVVAVGDAASLILHDKLLGVPLIVSGFLYQTNSKRLKGLSGVSLDLPAQAYMRLVRESIPGATRLCVLYDPEWDENFVSEAKKAAAAFQLQVFAPRVERQNEIGEALQECKNKGAQFFLITYNPKIMNPESFRYAVNFAVTPRMGLVVPGKPLVKNGGLISLEANYPAIGGQTAALVEKALAKTPASPELQFPKETEISVNDSIAKTLGIEFSSATLRKANYVH